MKWNRDRGRPVGVLQADVTAALARNLPTESLQPADELVTGDDR